METVNDRPRLFGAPYSVYVRIVRLVLAEKGVAYDLVPVDIFADGGPPADHLLRHPFGKIPAFAHDGFTLYETGAIARYVDEAFPGPRLQPTGIRERARCNQLIGIADSYAYPDLVWGVYVERVSKPARGVAADEARVASALERSRTCLAAITNLKGKRDWLAGDDLSLADLYLAPMLDYFLMAREGPDMLGAYPGLADWWRRIASRPSMRETAYPA